MAFTRLYAAIIIMAATIGPESIKMAFFGSPINKETPLVGSVWFISMQLVLCAINAVVVVDEMAAIDIYDLCRTTSNAVLRTATVVEEWGPPSVKSFHGIFLILQSTTFRS